VLYIRGGGLCESNKAYANALNCVKKGKLEFTVLEFFVFGFVAVAVFVAAVFVFFFEL
jgi:hypothetical protein